MINKSKSPNQIISYKEKLCKKCGEIITKDNRLFYGRAYTESTCKPCKKIINRENSRKKSAIIKANPLW